MEVFGGQYFNAWLDDTQRAAHVLAQRAEHACRGQNAVIDILMQHIRQFPADQQRLVPVGEVVRHQTLLLFEA